MRIINEKQETITEYDLSSGHLVTAIAIREDAKPIDNKKKFVWEDGDYEDVLLYVPNPVKTAVEQIAELKTLLLESDYKIIKCSEYRLLGLALPYDMEALHTQRQTIRDKINELEVLA